MATQVTRFMTDDGEFFDTLQEAEEAEARLVERDAPPLDDKIFGINENVMIDCETMSTAGNAAVLQIGAVRFNMYGLDEEFEVNISLEDLIKHGCDVSASTILWWLGRSTSARVALIEGQSRAVTIKSAMDSLTDFLMPVPWLETAVWGNDPSADNRWIMELCSKVGTPIPWEYYNNRCYRTFCAERKYMGIKRPKTQLRDTT